MFRQYDSLRRTAPSKSIHAQITVQTILIEQQDNKPPHSSIKMGRMATKAILIATLILLPLYSLLSGSIPGEARSVTNKSTTGGKCVISGKTNSMQGQIDGANYTIAVPTNWNGTLFLYSHPYQSVGGSLDNPAAYAPDTQTGNEMLGEGYALAATSYSQKGWAVQQAFRDQMDLVTYFNNTCGKPTRTIAWGSSMGGLITAGLVQLYPNSFNAAMPMCGLLAGSIGQFNPQLDGLYAFNLLIANNKLQIARFSNAQSTYSQAETLLKTAQQTAQGRARIALFSALEDAPGWATTGSPEPAATDYPTQENNQYTIAQSDFDLDILGQAEFEARAGGTASWNNGINYTQQLQKSVDNQEVTALYKQAGLNISQDLATLAQGTRVTADPNATKYASNYIVLNGKLNIPILTMHTTGDTLAMVQVEQAYASTVSAAGNGSWLQQTFVHRAGHCAFTSAERIAGVHTLINRLNSGTWGSTTSASAMNAAASKYGSSAFITYTPAPFIRP